MKYGDLLEEAKEQLEKEVKQAAVDRIKQKLVSIECEEDRASYEKRDAEGRIKKRKEDLADFLSHEIGLPPDLAKRYLVDRISNSCEVPNG